MELIESYLIELSQYLPKPHREDIIGELRASLEEQVVDRAAAHGRAPGREDELAVLAEIGHPLKVASGYREQRYLIGPELFPTFLQTVKLVVVIAFVAWFAAALMGAYAAGWQVSLVGIFMSLIEVWFWVVGIVTVVFVSLEYSGEKLNWYANWQPTSLSPDSASVVNRTDVLSNFVTEGVFLLWWNSVMVTQNWFPEDFPLTLSANWSVFFWPMNLIVGLAFVCHAYVLVRGVWHRLGLILEIVLDVALLGILAALLTGGALVDVDSRLDAISDNIQLAVRAVLVVVAGFTVWDVWLALRQLRGIRTPASFGRGNTALE